MGSEAVTVRKKKSNLMVFIFAAFFLILGFLVYTSFYNPNLKKTITGNIIREPKGEIEIEASLIPPIRMIIKGNVDKIELKTNGGDFYIGKEKFEIDKASIIIENYNGGLMFNNSYVSIDGTAEKVFVEGIPITGRSDIKINFDNVGYSFSKLNKVYIDDLFYKTSGVVRLNNEKALINLKNDDFQIEKFNGDVELRKEIFKVNGVVKKTNLGFIDVRPSASSSNFSTE